MIAVHSQGNNEAGFQVLKEDLGKLFIRDVIIAPAGRLDLFLDGGHIQRSRVGQLIAGLGLVNVIVLGGEIIALSRGPHLNIAR